MNFDSIRKHCLQKKGVTEELPFDNETPVFKVMGKMFLLISLDYPVSINIKSDPEEAVELRERYDSVIPGWHMNKRHWITVYLDGTIPPPLILEWIDKSYDLVAAGLKKTDRAKIQML